MRPTICVTVFLLAACAMANAQEQVTGKFTSYVGGRAIATESYTLTATADGGGLVPRIGQRGPKLRGFVILAGHTRELPGEVVRQYEYLFLEGEGPASDADHLRPRNVARQAVEDIADWIRQH